MALPDGWVSLPLSKVLLEGMINGRSVPTKDGGFPVLRLTALKGNRVDLSERKGGSWTRADAAPFLVTKGDFLVSRGNGSLNLVGRGALLDEEPDPVAFPDTIIRIRVDPRKLLPRFMTLQWNSRAVRRQIELAARTTAGIYKVNQSILGQIAIAIPPLNYQRRIVDILEDHLSRLDAADALLEKADVRGDKWRRSILFNFTIGAVDSSASFESLDEFNGSELGGLNAPRLPLPNGWVWAKWKDIGTCQNGKLFPSADYQDHGIRLLRPGNLGSDGRVTWTESATRFLPDQYRANANFILSRGDIVMNLTAQSLKDDFLGRVCIVTDNDEALLNQRIARLRARQVSAEFALLVFRSPLFRQYVKSLNTGSLIQHMFTRQVDEFWLPVPPVEVQRLLASEAFDREASVVRLQAAVYAAQRRRVALRVALLDSAFAGRLVGRPSDMDLIEEGARV